MTKKNSSNRKEMIKERTLEYQLGRKNNWKSTNMSTCNRLSPHELYKSYSIIETKIVILSDTQDNDT